MNTPEPSLSFDDTLNLSLHALLHERQSLETCLEQYPHYAAELKPLLQTALLTQRLKKPVMSEARIAALEERLMRAFPAMPDQIEETPTQPAPVRRPIIRFPEWLGRSAAIVALVLLATLGTGGGTVAASAHSVPGETLYGVKRAWEEFIVFIASLLGRLEDVRMHLARVRWEELEVLSQREQPISDGVWQGFIQSFSVAFEDADAQGQSDLMLVLSNIDKTVTQSVLPSSYREDLLRLAFNPGAPRGDQLPDASMSATQEAVPTETVVVTLTPTSTEAPTEALIVVTTPTGVNVIVATVTRTPTPSRTPTPTFTPSSTFTPQTPFPSPTATYTRLPLPIPSQTPVIPTPQDVPSLPDVIGPDGQPLPPDEGGGDNPPVDVPVGTIDPVIRPTMRAVYATQTALASGAEKSATPEGP